MTSTTATRIVFGMLAVAAGIQALLAVEAHAPIMFVCCAGVFVWSIWTLGHSVGEIL